MIDKIGARPLREAGAATKPTPSTKTEGAAPAVQGEFGGELEKALEGVRGALEGADKAAVDAMVGNAAPHTAMIAMTKADLALRFVTQTRNKAIEAYREIMNLQL